MYSLLVSVQSAPFHFVVSIQDEDKFSFVIKKREL